MSLKNVVVPKVQDSMQVKELGHLRKVVVDLRIHATMERMALSESAKEIFNVTLATQADDPMVHGKKERNPFTASQKRCELL